MDYYSLSFLVFVSSFLIQNKNKILVFYLLIALYQEMGAFGKSSSPPQPTNQFETPTANQTDAPTGQPAFQQPPSKEPQSQPKSGKNKFRVKTMQISAPPGLEGNNFHKLF